MIVKHLQGIFHGAIGETDLFIVLKGIVDSFFPFHQLHPYPLAFGL